MYGCWLAIYDVSALHILTTPLLDASAQRAGTVTLRDMEACIAATEKQKHADPLTILRVPLDQVNIDLKNHACKLEKRLNL